MGPEHITGRQDVVRCLSEMVLRGVASISPMRLQYLGGIALREHILSDSSGSVTRVAGGLQPPSPIVFSEILPP